MRPAVHHFVGRVREAVQSPWLLLAGLAGGLFAVVLDARFDAAWRHPLVFKSAGLFYVGTLASVIGSGAASSPGQGRFWSTRFMGGDRLDWAHPPLPLGLKTRILAEAAAAVVLILAWRIVLEPAFPLILRTGSWAGMSGFVRDRAIDACLLVPCAVAWMSPSRFRLLHLARVLIAAPLVVAWLVLYAPRFGIWSSAVAGLVLTGVLLELSAVRLRFTMPFRRAKRAGPLVRRARTPHSQLRHDLWLGPFTNNLQNYLLTSALGVALVAYVAVHARPRGGSFVSGMVLGLSLVFLTFPIGVPLLGRQGRLGGTALFGGSFAAAWANVPIRRETLLRGVYAHGLVWGCIMTLWVFTSMSASGVQRAWLAVPVGLAASMSVASALVCVAVGDRRRGILTIGAALLTLVGQVSMAKMFILANRDWAGSAFSVVAAVGLIGAAGSLPAFAHLFRRRARIEG